MIVVLYIYIYIYIKFIIIHIYIYIIYIEGHHGVITSWLNTPQKSTLGTR